MPNSNPPNAMTRPQGSVELLETFISAPHVRHAAARLRALRANPDVAITIDRILPVRGVEHPGRASISDLRSARLPAGQFRSERPQADLGDDLPRPMGRSVSLGLTGAL
jgi:hypothetical protein